MTALALKEAIRAAVESAIEETGVAVFKQTSMFPLSRRKASAVEQRQAA